jgi:uncharacterized membrane protein (DUF106 family)
MLELWNTLSLAFFDLLLGWLRALSPDVTVVAVAIGSAVFLALVRRWTTDQDLLGRVARDRRRLRELAREAKARGDREALWRHRAVRAAVGLKALRAEWRPLVVSVVPIAALATWGFARLGHHAPREGEAVEVTVYTPLSAVGDVAHIVPQEGISATPGGWVQEVVAAPEGAAGNSGGAARWSLQGEAREEPYVLEVRLGGRTYARELAIGPSPPSARRVEHEGDEVVTEIAMRPVDLWGLAPGIEALYLPPWVVAYLVVVIAAAWVLRRWGGVR